MFVEEVGERLVPAELHLSQLPIVPEIEVGGAYEGDVDAIVTMVAAAV